jgi:hypothetical protein
MALSEVIKDEDRLLRRVVIDPSYIKPDGSVTSFAFTPRKGEDGLSVDVERMTSYEVSIRDVVKYRLWALVASAPRNLGLDCTYNPVEGNDAHALIVGEINKGMSKKLSRAAIRVAYPD